MTLPCKVNTSNSENAETAEPVSLLARFLGSTDAADKYRKDADRREAARLRMAIARGAEHDRPAEQERPVVGVQSPSAPPVIDKGKLVSWIRSEIKAEVASTRREIEIMTAQAIEERLADLEDRPQ